MILAKQNNLLADNDIFWRPLKHNKKIKKRFCALLQGFSDILNIFCFCRLVLRIATDDSKAVCRLSVKFGATLKSSRLLLERAKELGLDVIGVSFHVGSGCTDPETYSQAISDARYVFDVGVSGLIAIKIQTTHLCNRIYLV